MYGELCRDSLFVKSLSLVFIQLTHRYPSRDPILNEVVHAMIHPHRAKMCGQVLFPSMCPSCWLAESFFLESG